MFESFFGNESRKPINEENEILPTGGFITQNGVNSLAHVHEWCRLGYQKWSPLPSIEVFGEGRTGGPKVPVSQLRAWTLVRIFLVELLPPSSDGCGWHVPSTDDECE